MRTPMRRSWLGPVVIGVLMVAGCASQGIILPAAPVSQQESPLYLIGPGDTVNVFVWGNTDLSASVPVRPDGRITTPLVEDVKASGKTPTQLAREMEKQLARYIKNPVVIASANRSVSSARRRSRRPWLTERT